MAKNGNEEEGADTRLWKAVTRDVKPLRGKIKTPEIAQKEPKAAPTKKTVKKTPVPAAPPVQVGTSQPPQLDGRTEARLRKGRISIDARLDLHGHTQASAHRVLEQFILTGHARGYRCLLIITGKGKMGEGILREKLPLWLSLPSLRPIIVKYTPAAPKDGGSGAFYLYLKKNKAAINH